MTDNRQKYAGELMDVADSIVRASTNKESDGRHLLAQAIFSWLTFNGDMHLKNLLLLKETRDLRLGFESVRLSPVYDIMCTQVYPDDAKSAAIGLAGSRNHTLAGFRALGAKFGVKSQEVDSMIDHLATSIPLWAERVAARLPGPIQRHALSVKHITQARELFDVRCMMMISELEAAKRTRTRKSVAEDVTSFSGALLEDGVSMEHVQAERRRSGCRP
jgi:serine/threonine protein kinase HipA of HipAB toxin-antitoxin module